MLPGRNVAEVSRTRRPVEAQGSPLGCLPGQIAVNWEIAATVVQISAHCDHSDDEKPITYQSYAAALTSGAEYAEFDIRKTADNVLVVYHDARAGRRGVLVRQLGHQELCDRLGY